ncbi:MAG TPA: HAD family hydrolase [Candidatus Edwardsbacteria bacterium]|nr:HAD family hydrolase [Candidatus Edwardsbacteria bacterium]
MATVFMDIDGTLLRGTSCERLFLPYLRRRGLLGWRQMASFAWFTLRWLRRDGADIFKVNKAYLSGLPVDEVAAAAGGFVRDIIMPRLDPTLVARLRAHLAKNDDVVLLSGAPDFIARPLAAAVGVRGAIAAVCAADHGAFTGARPVVHPLGKNKLFFAEMYCQKNGLDIQYTIAYADHCSDRFLLERAGTAVAVHPDAGLRRRARARNWETID